MITQSLRRSEGQFTMPLTERVDPKHTALVVVDVQNDFYLPTGLWAASGVDVSATGPMIANAKVLIESARGAGVLIVFVRTSYDSPVLSPPLAESQFIRRGFTGICYMGTDGFQLVDGIGPTDSAREIIVDKHRYSAFWGTRLDLVLRSNGIKTLVMAGVATDVCVESTIRDGFCRDYHIVEAAEAVSTIDPDVHAASQRRVDRAFGPVVPMAQIMSAWETSRGSERYWHAEHKSACTLAPVEQEVSPAKSALVLVDVQNDLCHPKGSARRGGGSFGMVDEALPRIKQLLERARLAGVPIFHIKTQNSVLVRSVGSRRLYPAANRDGFSTCVAATEFETYDVRFDDPNLDDFRAGSWGGEFVDGIVPRAKEHVVVKHRYSAFVDTRLETLLRANGIQTVVLAGMTTNCSVESTVRDAQMRDFHVVVAEDCVATKDGHNDLHSGSLETMRTHFARVVPSSTILSAWSQTYASGNSTP